MLPFRDRPIRQKLMLLLMLTSSLALFLGSSVYVLVDLYSVRESMVRKVTVLGNVLGSQCAGILRYREVATAPRETTLLLGNLAAEPDIIGASVFDRTRQIVARYERNPGVGTALPTVPDYSPPRFEGGYLEGYFPIESVGTDRRSRLLGTLYLRFDVSEMRARMAFYLEVVAITFLIAVGIAGLISSRLESLVSRPILDLAHTAREVSRNSNYSLRAPKQGDDEVGHLVDGFNHMLGGIQERDDDLTRARQHLEERVNERTRALRLEIAERTRAEDDLRQQFARISLLNQIAKAMSQRQDLASLLNVVAAELNEHLPVPFSALCLIDDATGALHTEAMHQRINADPGSAPSFPTVHGRLADAGLDACAQGEVLYEADLAATAHPILQALARHGLGSAVAAPLMAEEKLVGILLVAREPARAFDPGERDFLRSLGHHAALAVRQARLHADLKRAYDDLRQSQLSVMQNERLRAMGQMASGIAHDINNAISPVAGYTALLLRQEAQLSPQARRQLQLIGAAAESVAAIVARLREFYRRQPDDEQKTSIDVGALLAHVAELTAPRWRSVAVERGCNLDVVVDTPEPLPRLLGLETELREVLTNLVLNAIDAMPNGGRITLRARPAGHVRTGPDPDRPSHVTVEVADTGAGMDEETRRRCFEAFFSTKGKRGTGLGLFMAHRIVEAHGGTIDVESATGQGSVFRLMFPVREVPLAPEPAAPADPIQAPPARILFVDDEAMLRELVHEMLVLDGHTVETADSGEAALVAFRTAARSGKPFDVVITDLGMPRMDGRELARLLKAESPDTPIIVMTGWGTLMRGEEDLKAPVDGLLSKPPSIPQLQAVLSRVLKRPKAS